MAGEAMLGLSIFNTMMNMAKALKDIDNGVARNAAVIALQEQILMAQAEQSALIASKGELEAQLRRFETWESEKQRYELHEIKPGRFTRRLKEAMAQGEPTHDICTQCYNHGIASILQNRKTEVGRYHLLVCGECKTELNLTLAV